MKRLQEPNKRSATFGSFPLQALRAGRRWCDDLQDQPPICPFSFSVSIVLKNQTGSTMMFILCQWQKVVKNYVTPVLYRKWDNTSVDYMVLQRLLQSEQTQNKPNSTSVTLKSKSDRGVLVLQMKASKLNIRKIKCIYLYCVTKF